ncbi:molybdopterin converting factor subunit 1 [Pokkaliibacter sp. CJK22405]|uniref:molybdopterin converting factor subunit 1 n=1 Tax=Pokkaliibacter sp. CJK22405 TaxID=3384615 RepID=UPI003985262C
MLKVLFFASLRERIGLDDLEWPYQSGLDVQGLLEQLQGQGQPWHDVLASPSLLAAVNQEMAARSKTLTDGDEVAFFPPVSGG